jgi:hypothetical protein
VGIRRDEDKGKILSEGENGDRDEKHFKWWGNKW